MEAIKVKPLIYAEFPETVIPNSKLVFETRDMNFRFSNSESPLWSKPLNLVVKGPSKVAIDGLNGSGKSTFLNLLTSQSGLNGQMTGHLKLGNLNYSYIDQRLTVIDQEKSVLENVERHTKKSVVELRNLLAQFLFNGKTVNQLAGTLSGGEKLRLALAKSLLADPAPQLLILDEPTNNIDVTNLEFLEAALEKFKGALIVVSHDVKFVENINVDHRISLQAHV